LLNRKALSELAVWEPATFEAIAKICKDVVDKEKSEKVIIDRGYIPKENKKEKKF
jgi:hypothetical protein